MSAAGSMNDLASVLNMQLNLRKVGQILLMSCVRQPEMLGILHDVRRFPYHDDSL